MSMKPLLLIHILHLFFLSVTGLDTLYPGQSISLNQTLISRKSIFELGFFNDYSGNYLIGIWYKQLPSQTIVWVGNPGNPIVSQLPKLALSTDGGLMLHGDDEPIMIWRSRSSSEFNSTKLVLEDNGNLVMRIISNPSDVVWQSFDHPLDTWLPGAKVGFNKLTRSRQVYSWQDYSSPSFGFSFELDVKNMSSIRLSKSGTRYGTCRLNGFALYCSLELVWYTGEVEVLLSKETMLSYVSNENETYLTYTMTDSTMLTRFVIDQESGSLVQLMWSDDSQVWEPSKLRLADAYCDKFAVYNHQSDHSHDCKCSRQTQIQCHEGKNEGFVLIPNVTMDLGAGTVEQASEKGCGETCLRNCSCTVYNDQGGCRTWQQGWSDFYYHQGWDLHIRLATTKTRKAKLQIDMTILGAVTGGISLTIILVFLIWKCKSIKFLQASKVMEGSLMLFRYSDLRTATKNFTSKLGEGGFGSVYKGTLVNPPDNIAVKKLKLLCQGEKQFRAEVSTLGTIHHVNLVRLKGFCVEGTKRILVYDYMPHGSLDKHLFGGSPGILDWRTRYQIALGIAKGLAYLHEECRECIIHCDIKPENVLLDAGFNAKLSDFGLAKLLGRDFSRVLTTIRGTRGYLAPEWISGIAITTKADVYSYGMMLFEIISGRRNWCIRINGENDYSPLQVMQKLISDEGVIDLLDSKLEGNANTEELIRICRVAGWCIQDDEKDRPSVIHIVQILEGVSEVVTPPMPRFLQYIEDIPKESLDLASLSY